MPFNVDSGRDAIPFSKRINRTRRGEAIEKDDENETWELDEERKIGQASNGKEVKGL